MSKSNSSLELSKCGTGKWEIVVDDTVIGHIWGDLNHLDYIKLDEDYRENGYGGLAVKKYIEKARSQSVESIQTTKVIDDRAERILNNNDFERDSATQKTFKLDMTTNSQLDQESAQPTA